MKTYIKPETMELVCSDALCKMITVSAGQTTGNNWSREEEDLYWDEEEGW